MGYKKENGKRIGWKLAGSRYNPKLVKMEIRGRVVSPKDGDRKRRCAFVNVVRINDLDRDITWAWRLSNEIFGPVPSAGFHGLYGIPPTVYQKGRITRAHRLDKNVYVDCGAGISFFDTMREALNYNT